MSEPQTARLDPVGQFVAMDFTVQSWPYLARMFIYYHELSHIYYNNPPGKRILEIELKADEGASDELSPYFSKTQILGAMETAIHEGPEKQIRINHIDNYLSWMQY